MPRPKKGTLARGESLGKAREKRKLQREHMERRGLEEKEELEKAVERLAEEVDMWKWRHEGAEVINEVLKDQVDELSRDNRELNGKIDRERAAHRETMLELQRTRTKLELKLRKSAQIPSSSR
ncbi:unnamed protein product [Caenorhabditis sp. 36 PRJEB53466]|nr:unnamed protein product [Caenorhabditis sp. 36 PRJEB53466]